MAPEARTIKTGGSGEGRLTAEYVAARALLDATSIEEAAARTLQAICASLAWEHGALWTVDRESDCLRCAQIWSLPESRFPEFQAVSQGMTFRRGIGRPGRVWANAMPAWIPDGVADANFPRALYLQTYFPGLVTAQLYWVVGPFVLSKLVGEPKVALMITALFALVLVPLLTFFASNPPI
jgi:hypothetical protein